MERKEILKNFLQKVVLPVVLAVFLFPDLIHCLTDGLSYGKFFFFDKFHSRLPESKVLPKLL